MKLMPRGHFCLVHFAFVILLLAIAPFEAHGYEHEEEQEHGEEVQKWVRSSVDTVASSARSFLSPPIAFAALAIPASNDDRSSSSGHDVGRANGQESSWSWDSENSGVTDRPDTRTSSSHLHSEEYVRQISSKSSMVYIEVTESSRYTMNISAEAGDLVNIVTQLQDYRHHSGVIPENCRGYAVSVEIRAVDVNGHAAANNTDDLYASGAWSLFWNSIATIMDSSAFCELLPTVMLRVEPVQVPRSYHFIINARRGYLALANNYTCKMRVYVEQNSAASLWWQQDLFALTLPLLLLVFTVPITLWHIYLVPPYMVDIDVVIWMGYPVYAMRDLLLSMMAGVYGLLWGCYAERQEERRQRELEEQHRHIMQEARARQAAPSTQQEQQQEREMKREEEVGAAILTSANGGNNDGCHEEEEHNKAKVVHMQQSVTSAAKTTGTHTSSKKEHYNEEKQQLLSKRVEEDEEHDADMSSSITGGRVIMTSTTRLNSPIKYREEDNNNKKNNNNNPPATAVVLAAAAATTTSNSNNNNNNNNNGNLSTVPESHGVAETPSMCVVHMHTPPLPPREFALDQPTTEGIDSNNANGGGHRTVGFCDEDRIFRNHPSEGCRLTAVHVHKNKSEHSEDEGSEDEHICRICRDGEEVERLVSACECTGSVRWVHRSCLDRWRLTSAKRNMQYVQRCEICRQPFRFSIRRRTLLLQSSQQTLRAVLLVLCLIFSFTALAVFLHATLGEMACHAPWRSVAYSNIFSLDGAVVTVFVYSILTLLAVFSFVTVYSHWHMRAETTAHVLEFQALPVFWTRRNTLAVCAVYILGVAHALALGLLLKLFMYRTSSIVWSWEASPSAGAVMYITVLILAANAVRQVRAWRGNRAARQELEINTIVVEAGSQQRGEEVPVSSNTNETREEQEVQQGGEDTNTVIQPQMRSIRAVEYCPRRPVTNRP